MADKTLTLPGPHTLRGAGTVTGWRARIFAAWRVLVYGRVNFVIETDEITIEALAGDGNG